MRQLGYELTRSWEYQEADGETAFVVLRFDHPSKSKSFRQLQPVNGAWTTGLPGHRPLYELASVLESDDIVVVEGEKAAVAARSIGLVATTSVGGAGQARHTDWSPLAGKSVTILPDNDPPGATYARTVLSVLAGLQPPPTVRVVALPDLPSHGDIVEFIDAARARGLGDEECRRHLADRIASTAPTELGKAESSETDESTGPFPTHVLPPGVREFVEAIAETIPCDPAFAALPVLASLSVCIGNSARAVLKSTWAAPAVLWLIVVADSGAGKSPAAQAALAPLMEIEAELRRVHAERFRNYELEFAKWDAEHGSQRRGRKADAIRPDPPKPPIHERITTDDITIEALSDLLAENPRGLAVIRDEGAGWIEGFDRYAKSRGAEVARWLEIYDARSLKIDRKTAAKRHTFVPMAFVTVFAGIQPAVLQRTLREHLIQNGFFARLLLAKPPRRPKSWRRDDQVPQWHPRVADTLRRLRKLEPFFDDAREPTPRRVHFAASAYELWVRFYDEFAREQWTASGARASMLAKVEGAVPRLALIFHLADLASEKDLPEDLPPITASAVERAIELALWFQSQADELLRTIAPADATAIEFLRGKITEGYFDVPRTARDVGRCRWCGITNADSAASVLEELVSLGELVVEAATAGRGRPTVRYRRPSDSADVQSPPTEGGRHPREGFDTSRAVDERRIDETPTLQPPPASQAGWRAIASLPSFPRGPNGVTKPCREAVHV
ncbi:MAG: DUF3987 domain-containing protein [Planctomycetes bacterium]|nr:DUF3987 domain-containing protein [Planctomycetota bacterium]